MQITSSAFPDNGEIPLKYTCDGDDVSPPLTIARVPPGTKSLALIVDDPDAPAGVWTHWVVYDMTADTREIPEGTEPAGVPGMTSFRRGEYGGPCPPDREHRYFFKLYALDSLLRLPVGAAKADVETAMAGHIVEQAELVARYRRSH